MRFTIVFDFLMALSLNFRTVLQHKPVASVRQILFLNQHALECLWIKAEGSAALESPFIGIEKNEKLFKSLCVLSVIDIEILIRD